MASYRAGGSGSDDEKPHRKRIMESNSSTSSADSRNYPDDSNESFSPTLHNYVWIATSDILFQIRERMEDFIVFLKDIESNSAIDIRNPQSNSRMSSIFQKSRMSSKRRFGTSSFGFARQLREPSTSQNWSRSSSTFSSASSNPGKKALKQAFDIVRNLMQKIYEIITRIADNLEPRNSDDLISSDSEAQSDSENSMYAQYVFQIVYYLLDIVSDQMNDFVNLLTLAHVAITTGEMPGSLAVSEFSDLYNPRRSYLDTVKFSNRVSIDSADRSEFKVCASEAMRTLISIYDQVYEFLSEYSPDDVNDTESVRSSGFFSSLSSGSRSNSLQPQPKTDNFQSRLSSPLPHSSRKPPKVEKKSMPAPTTVFSPTTPPSSTSTTPSETSSFETSATAPTSPTSATPPETTTTSTTISETSTTTPTPTSSTSSKELKESESNTTLVDKKTQQDIRKIAKDQQNDHPVTQRKSIDVGELSEGFPVHSIDSSFIRSVDEKITSSVDADANMKDVPPVSELKPTGTLNAPTSSFLKPSASRSSPKIAIKKEENLRNISQFQDPNQTAQEFAESYLYRHKPPPRTHIFDEEDVAFVSRSDDSLRRYDFSSDSTSTDSLADRLKTDSGQLSKDSVTSEQRDRTSSGQQTPQGKIDPIPKNLEVYGQITPPGKLAQQLPRDENDVASDTISDPCAPISSPKIVTKKEENLGNMPQFKDPQQTADEFAESYLNRHKPLPRTHIFDEEDVASVSRSDDSLRRYDFSSDSTSTDSLVAERLKTDSGQLKKDDVTSEQRDRTSSGQQTPQGKIDPIPKNLEVYDQITPPGKPAQQLLRNENDIASDTISDPCAPITPKIATKKEENLRNVPQFQDPNQTAQEFAESYLYRHKPPPRNHIFDEEDVASVSRSDDSLRRYDFSSDSTSTDSLAVRLKTDSGQLKKDEVTSEQRDRTPSGQQTSRGKINPIQRNLEVYGQLRPPGKSIQQLLRSEDDVTSDTIFEGITTEDVAVLPDVLPEKKSTSTRSVGTSFSDDAAVVAPKPPIQNLEDDPITRSAPALSAIKPINLQPKRKLEEKFAAPGSEEVIPFSESFPSERSMTPGMDRVLSDIEDSYNVKSPGKTFSERLPSRSSVSTPYSSSRKEPQATLSSPVPLEDTTPISSPTRSYNSYDSSSSGKSTISWGCPKYEEVIKGDVDKTVHASSSVQQLISIIKEQRQIIDLVCPPMGTADKKSGANMSSRSEEVSNMGSKSGILKTPKQYERSLSVGSTPTGSSSSSIGYSSDFMKHPSVKPAIGILTHSEFFPADMELENQQIDQVTSTSNSKMKTESKDSYTSTATPEYSDKVSTVSSSVSEPAERPFRFSTLLYNDGSSYPQYPGQGFYILPDQVSSSHVVPVAESSQLDDSADKPQLFVMDMSKFAENFTQQFKEYVSIGKDDNNSMLQLLSQCLDQASEMVVQMPVPKKARDELMSSFELKPKTSSKSTSSNKQLPPGYTPPVTAFPERTDKQSSDEDEELDMFLNDTIEKATNSLFRFPRRDTLDMIPEYWSKVSLKKCQVDSSKDEEDDEVALGRKRTIRIRPTIVELDEEEHDNEKTRKNARRNSNQVFDEKEEMAYEAKVEEEDLSRKEKENENARKKTAKVMPILEPTNRIPRKVCSTCSTTNKYYFKDMVGPTSSGLFSAQSATGLPLHCSHIGHPLNVIEIREIDEDGHLNVYTEDWLENEEDFARDWRWKNGLLANIIRVQTLRPASKDKGAVLKVQYDPMTRRARGSLAEHQIETVRLKKCDTDLPKVVEKTASIPLSYSTPVFPESLENVVYNTKDALQSPHSTRHNWRLLNKMYMFFDQLQRVGYGAGPPLIIKIRREFFLSDASECLMIRSNIPLHYYRDLRVVFKDTKAYEDKKKNINSLPADDTREAFYLFSQYLFTPYYKQLFDHPSETADCLHLNPASPSVLHWFQFAGVILALSFIHQKQLGILLPRSFFKCILNRPLVLADVQEVDPELYERLDWINRNNLSEDEYNMYYSMQEKFGSVVYEADLFPGSGNIQLSDNNKHSYIETALKWTLAERYLPQLKLFIKGFVSVIDAQLLNMFSDYELQQLVAIAPREPPTSTLTRRETW